MYKKWLCYIAFICVINLMNYYNLYIVACVNYGLNISRIGVFYGFKYIGI